ncbi:hypothetical protein [Paenibacillus massiliensis]|uniref:hypothetical protein n=1 Tax=Paenibacillus massiliensis TaxID=225917 RepID=UPI00046F0339|nr:hypothetical protein [Paenibacillus massiliensis]
MSAYEEFAAERAILDDLLNRGYVVRSVQEGLDGADVVLIQPAHPDQHEQVHLGTADARKYLGTLLVSGAACVPIV